MGLCVSTEKKPQQKPLPKLPTNEQLQKQRMRKKFLKHCSYNTQLTFSLIKNCSKPKVKARDKHGLVFLKEREVVSGQPKRIQKKLEKLFGNRDMRQSRNSLQFPYSAIGLIQSIFGEKQFFKGTGFLIDLNIVLTCAHNLYDDETKKQTLEVKFYPAINGSKGKVCGVKRFFYPQQYKDQDKAELYDFAVLQLDENLGIQYGYLGTNFQQNYFQGEADLYGYPGYLGLKNQKKVENEIHGTKGEWKLNSSKNHIIHWIQSSEGQSGSPIFIQQKQDYVVLGIHTHSYGSQNRGISLSPMVCKYINKWVGKESGKLHLSNQFVTDKMIQTIQQNDFTSLTEIYLQYNRVQEQGVRLLSNINLPNLKILWLYKNDIGDKGLEYLTDSNWHNLRQLSLGENNISKEGIRNLIKGDWPYLELLWLRRIFTHYTDKNNITDLINIHRAKWPRLFSLDLSYNPINISGIKNLIQAKFPKLTILKLNSYKSHVIITDQGFQILSQGKWVLCQLHLQNNSVTDLVLPFFEKAVWIQQLQTLMLDKNKISSNGLIKLLQITKNSLQKISVKQMYFQNPEAIEIIASIKAYNSNSYKITIIL